MSKKGNISKTDAPQAAKATWTPKQSEVFIQIAHDLSLKGKYTSGFKKKEWNAIVKKFKELTGAGYSKEQMQSHLSTWKKNFTIFHALKVST